MVIQMECRAAACGCKPVPPFGASRKSTSFFPEPCVKIRSPPASAFNTTVCKAGSKSNKGSCLHNLAGIVVWRCIFQDHVDARNRKSPFSGGRNGGRSLITRGANGETKRRPHAISCSQAVASDTNGKGNPPDALSAVRVILVEPRGALNVGMVARGMANFGLKHLVLVNPQGEAADYRGEEACRMACHAVPILEAATVAPTLAAALAGVTRSVATTARQRAPPAPPLEILRSGTAGGCLEWLLEAEEGYSALVFGREDSGLTNDELSFAQRTLMIPSSPAYSSLNLSHAVAVVCYELSQQAQAPRSPERAPLFQEHATTSTSLDTDVSTSRDERSTAAHSQQMGRSSYEAETDGNVDTLQSSESNRTEESSKVWERDSKPSTSGDSAMQTDEEANLGPEGPVGSADSAERPGWRKTRRLDRALKRTDVADGADVEGALKQAEALLTKMGFLKGEMRNAKVPKLRQLLVRASPTNSEVALLRAILRRMDWHVTKAQENIEP